MSRHACRRTLAKAIMLGNANMEMRICRQTGRILELFHKKRRIEWNGQPMAVPSSLIMALHPLTSSQAQQLRGKKSVVLAKRTIPRVPLSEPEGAAQDTKIVPSWLIHFSIGDREFFILADRALGYRRVPEGTDLSRQRRMKIGKTVYSILNRAALPSSAVTSGSE